MAGRSGPGWRLEGGGRRRVREQPLEEGVLVLQRLHAAIEVIHLGLEQLDPLGQRGDAPAGPLRTFEPARQRSADRRIHYDREDGDQEGHEQEYRR